MLSALIADGYEVDGDIIRAALNAIDTSIESAAKHLGTPI